MDILLLSQDEFHPFYRNINSYFYDAMKESLPPDTGFFSKPPPLGITLLASHLNLNGFSALPVHNFFTREDSKQLLIKSLQEKPFAVGISTTHIFNRSMMDEITGLVTRLSPGSRIIVGGPGAEWNSSLRPDRAITVLGPGETTLLSLLKALKAGEKISDIPNLAYSEGVCRKETRREDNSPLQLVPLPDWGLYKSPPKRVSLQGSRGCLHSCAFCSYNGGFSMREPGAILAEIRNNRRRWGINFFRFTDADIVADKNRAMELCRALQEEGGYSWTCFARADSLLDPALLEAMKKAGCLWIFIGIESGSDRILKAMNKGCGVSLMKEAIARVRAAGIGVHGNFIVGYPGEDAQTLKETLAFVRNSGLDTVYFSPFQIRSLDIPVYLRRKEYSLQGDFMSWRHSGMTSEEMLACTSALMEEVWTSMAAPLLTSEVFFSFFTHNEGPGFRENVLDFAGAMRDWHRARKSGDGLKEGRASDKMRAHLLALD